jgi:hypothetical protein
MEYENINQLGQTANKTRITTQKVLEEKKETMRVRLHNEVHYLIALSSQQGHSQVTIEWPQIADNCSMDSISLSEQECVCERLRALGYEVQNSGNLHVSWEHEISAQ